MTGRRTRLLAVAAAAVWVAALGAHRHALEEANDRLRSTRPMVERTRARDRLIGRRWAWPAGARSVGGEELPARPDLVWVLVVDRCHRCLESWPAWRALSGPPSRTGAVLLLGLEAERGRRVARSLGLAGPVAARPAARLSGLDLSAEGDPSMLVLTVGEAGVIRSVAARSGGSPSCRWRPAAQAGALAHPGRDGRFVEMLR